MIANLYVRVSAAFGVLAALLILLYFFGFYWAGKNPLLYMSTFDLVIPIVCMTLAMFYYRDRRMEGKMHFWEGLLIGLLTNFTGTFLSAMGIYLYVSAIGPELLDTHIADLQNLIIQSKQQINEQFGKGAYENTLQKVRATTAADVALDIFLKKFLICLFASGFVAAVLRKNQ